MALLLRNREHALLASLVAAITGAHLVWLMQDDGALPIQDGYIYLSKLLAFLDAPAPSSLPEAWSSLKRLSHGGRPPLYSLLTIPSILLFGRSVASACTINLVFLPTLMIFTYRYARSFSSARAGLLAAFLVGTYPPLVHLTRNYMPYSILPACCIVSLWLLAQLFRQRSIKTAWLWSASLGFGAMIHPNFLRFAMPTAVLFGIYLWLVPKEFESSAREHRLASWIKGWFMDPLFLRGLLPGALMVGFLVGSWYLTVGYRLLTLTRHLNSGVMEEFRGQAITTIGFETTGPAFWFLKTAPGTVSWVLAFFALVGVVVGILKRRPWSWLLVVALTSTYAIFDQLTTRAWWSFSMVLPIAAVLTAWWIAEIRPRWLSVILTMVCVVIGGFNFSMVTWGLNPSLKPLAIALGAPIDEPETCYRRAALSLCPAPARPSLGPLPELEAVGLILQDSECQKKTCQLLKLGGSISWIHLQYLVKAQHPGSALHIVRANSPRYGRLYGLPALLESDFLLYPQGNAKDDGNLYTAASLKFLRSPPQIFSDTHRTLGIYGQSMPQRLILAKRVAPLSALEAETSIAALELDERYLGGKFLLLSSLYLSEGNVKAMRRLFEEAREFPVSAQTESRLRRDLKKARKQKAFEKAAKHSEKKSEGLEGQPSIPSR